MKRALSVLLSCLLFVPLLTPFSVGHADANKVVFEVLEIVSHLSSPSPLEKAIGNRNDMNITTMTMKRFVALRDELDGKYDAIVISEGNYNPAGVGNYSNRAAAHDTTNKLNDITRLRAQQIKQFYIDKGLPVFLHEDVLNYPNSKLYQHFAQYKTNPVNNVIFFKTRTNLQSHFAKFGSKHYVERPRIELTNRPSSTQPFKKGDTLNFSYEVINYREFSNKLLTVNLYIDADFNDKYTSEEIVVSKQVQRETGSIQYTLPAGFSGVRYWKVELVDEASALKDYVKGDIKFQDVPPKINVLQIRQGNDQSSLLNSKNMNQSYLKRTNEYEIDIDVTTLNEFQKSKADQPNYSHEVINGKYDMLIFGFADCYNGCNNPINLNPNAVQSIESFIDTGQSVMFTHDTMFGKNNVWVNEFGPIVGQIQPQTDLGNGAPNTSTKTKKINSGLITDYPFSLGDSIQIARTHNQYYTLDLEDETIIPWYNIDGDPRDVYDSWNHYYTYSKGNVTYSGTGHVGTSAPFPDDEQKLFVNTMYRAFIGSNHAPMLTVYTPKENEKIPSNQNIELSYKVEDLDLIDRTISTKVWLNEEVVYSQDNVPNGMTIIQSIPHEMPNGGVATIKIEATDAKGAKVTKEIQVTIEKVSADIEIVRTLSPSTLVPVDDTVAVQYTLNPKQLPLSSNTNPVLNVTNIQFEETLPAGVEVVSLPSGFVKEGNVQQGYTIKGTLADIQFNKVGDAYVASPQSFTIQFAPKQKGEFAFQQAKLSYTDLNGQDVSLSFNPLRLVADYEIESISLPDTVFVNQGVPKNLNLLLNVMPIDATIAAIEWSENSGNSVVSIDQNGVLTAINQGSAEVTVRVRDVFGNEQIAKTKAIVRIPVESISISDFTVNVGETKPIPITIIPADAKDAVSYSLGDNLYAKLDAMNGTITGLKEGTTTLTVVAFDVNDQLIEKKVSVTVQAVPVKTVIVSPTAAKVNIGETISLTATVLPTNATYKEVRWSSSDSNIARVDENGNVIGVSTGTATITATAHNGVYASAVIEVGLPLTGIVLPQTVTVEKGKTVNVLSYLEKVPANATTKIIGYQFSVENSYYAVVDQNGKVTAKRLGATLLTVEVTDETNNKWTATTTIRVVENADNPSRNGDKNGWLY